VLSGNPIIGEVKIKAVPEPYKIRKEIEAMQYVTTVHFQLIHPNPGKSEFNLYNKIIHENRAKQLDIKMNNDKGLQLKHSNDNREESEKETIEEIVLQNFLEIEESDVQAASPIEINNNSYTDSIENGISLVESGYGTVEVKGFDEIITEGRSKRKKRSKRKRFFSSKQSIRMIKTNEHSKEKLLSRLLSFILDVKNKVMKEGDSHDTTKKLRR
jgi:hypothetical protein